MEGSIPSLPARFNIPTLTKGEIMVVKCDFCGRVNPKEYVDGKTNVGPWANMCTQSPLPNEPTCYEANGIGKLGLGFGQRYQRQSDGSYKKVEG